MNKIITGMLSIALTLSLVAGIAYANFTNSAKINGIVLATTTPDLRVSLGGPTLNFASTINVTGHNMPAISPGEVSGTGVFVLKNFGDAPLNLKGFISSYSLSSDWDDLKDKMLAISCVVPATTNPVQQCQSVPNNTGWKTLAQSQTPVTVPEGALGPGEERILLVNFKLPSDADNSYAGKSITGMQITIDGETL